MLITVVLTKLMDQAELISAWNLGVDLDAILLNHTPIEHLINSTYNGHLQTLKNSQQKTSRSRSKASVRP